jgi:serine/threonine protein kinase
MLYMDDVDTVKKVSRVNNLQATSDLSEAFIKELVLWRYLRHENIVVFIGTCPAFEVSLISEWMSGGTITRFLLHNPQGNRHRYVRPLSERIGMHATYRVIQQVDDILRGLTYMHLLDVVHGDLKAVVIS